LVRNISLYVCYGHLFNDTEIWFFDSMMRVQHSPNLCDGNPFLKNHRRIKYTNQNHNNKIPDSQLVKLLRFYISPKSITLSTTVLLSQANPLFPILHFTLEYPKFRIHFILSV